MAHATELDCAIQTKSHGGSQAESLAGALRVFATKETYGPLERAYDTLNEELFEGRLPGCVLTLQRERRNSYGYFSKARWVSQAGVFADEIAVNPNHFAVIPLLECLQILGHEMCHQAQAAFGKPGRRGYHNREFASMMANIGLQTSTTGRPGGKATGESMSDYPIPGGRFLSVAHALISAGFRIQWMDRFPPAAVVKLAQHQAESPVDLGHEPSPQLLAASTPLTADQLTRLSIRATVEAPPAPPTRWKFTCQCGENIWGKRTTLATCPTCESPFQRQD